MSRPLDAASVDVRHRAGTREPTIEAHAPHRGLGTGRIALLATIVAVTLAGIVSAILMVRGEVPWPFPVRPSLVVLDDPDLRREIGLALLAVAAGFMAAGLALVARRLLWPAMCLAAAASLWAAPHLRLLLVEAYPTSFYRSPTGFASESIVRGERLFAQACASCHGAEGRGDGPLARTLADPPADLTASHLWDHSDGEMFWWLTHGIDGPEGGLFMPGFADRLPPDDRWSLIDYVRAHNAGASMRATGAWPRAVGLPGFRARCDDGRSVESGDLHGRVVRLIVTGGGEPAMPVSDTPDGDVIDIYAPTRPEGTRGCAAEAPALLDALATVTGDSRQSLAGTQFLSDPEGWLRDRHRAGEPGGWSTTASLRAEVGRICRHRVTADGSVDTGTR